MSIDVRVAHINVKQPASNAVRKYNINGVIELIKNGGVGTFNEMGKTVDHRYINSLKPLGIGSYIYGENAIVWDAKRFDLVFAGKFLVMVGGYVGADGTKKGPDNRRVGPSRHLVVAVLKDRATGIIFQAATTHLIAKAFTQHKWRQKIFYASVNAIGSRLNSLNKKYPNGFLTGDMNFIGAKIDFPYLAEVQLPPLRTYGKAKYDRSYVWGQAKLVPGTMKTFVRKSDHKGVTFVLRIGGGANTTPAVSHTSSGGVKPGPRKSPKPARKPPVPRPWLKRTRRWKRRHPILWRRIVRWRKNNPRKK